MDINKYYADEYDSTKSYSKNDRCVFNKEWYECLDTTTGTFDESKWKKRYLVEFIGGGTDSELQPILLWENSSPTATYTAQTETIDSSAYDNIVIECRYSTSDTSTSKTLITKSTNSEKECSASNGSGVAYREATVSDTDIIFYTGQYRTGSTHTNNNNYCIPVKVYGIKDSTF